MLRRFTSYRSATSARTTTATTAAAATVSATGLLKCAVAGTVTAFTVMSAVNYQSTCSFSSSSSSNSSSSSSFFSSSLSSSTFSENLDFKTIVPNLFVSSHETASAATSAASGTEASISDTFEKGPRDDQSHLKGKKFDYDLVVIGGGSGGLACAKRAAQYGAEVAICDFVEPSPQGTTWGLGGTCVNVGCIPKKLMHGSALLGEAITHTSSAFGWGHNEEEQKMMLQMEMSEEEIANMSEEERSKKLKSNKLSFDWQRLRQNVQDHIRSLNFGYITELRTKDIAYLNVNASFIDNHTIECVDKKGEKKTVAARRFVIATGGRPMPLRNVPGSEHCITSDDLFFGKVSKNPGRVLVVGAGYIALECAGLLQTFGFPATVMARSVPLRTMDQQCAKFVCDDLEKRIGVKIMTGALPSKIEKDEKTGKLRVSYTVKSSSSGRTLAAEYEEFDTVVAAVGRYPETKRLHLDKSGVQCSEHNGKVLTNSFDRTSASNIYAIGDVAFACPELTPVAIKAGTFLADRLFSSSQENANKTIDYAGVPTTVFTPLEYGFVGHSEESAVQTKFNGDASKVESYLSAFTPLEWTVPHLPNDSCFMKLVVEKETDKVLGFHIVSPNAGEITQGVAVALTAGATRKDFNDTIGIHPTIAEDMTNLTVTKSSGASFSKGGC